ncbi:hypothetical protein QJS10_CPA06g02059 [Acorus calamus]|uniref:RanBP2-type domain-containing protein n=1 Tax=Acorus calamus TaxID=4465 RepID=A0AAV9EPV7_ACOCL|nr:hypothetical protein QJS10_CPA06g02059 [Acorus calamus]
MKKGDWTCLKCNFVNFARNIRCLACKEDGPRRVDPSGIEMKSGDWICPQCQFMNFARNNHCFRCRTSRPYRELKPGDWECPSCGFLNFRKNLGCLKCSCSRPELSPGDWSCPLCNFPNFRRNTVCLKCKNPNPSKTDPYAGHIWRKPGVPSTMKSKFGIDDREYKDHARGKAGKPTTASTEALTDDNWFPKLFSDDESDWSDNQQMEDGMPILRGKKESLVSKKRNIPAKGLMNYGE